MIQKRIAQNTESQAWTDSCELLMMTSATLVEALYEACDEWLQERGKSKITELDEKDRIKNILKSFGRFIFQEIVHVCLGKHLAFGA